MLRIAYVARAVDKRCGLSAKSKAVLYGCLKRDLHQKSKPAYFGREYLRSMLERCKYFCDGISEFSEKIGTAAGIADDRSDSDHSDGDGGPDGRKQQTCADSCGENSSPGGPFAARRDAFSVFLSFLNMFVFDSIVG